ncbi:MULTISPECIES: DUF6576 domain-containing protein [Amniculibacterium]|jgi:hypothetical protein|uniref:DUF6576 domain-containing protein n=1 Tax=Amniculibacterium TaxID=2715289 RepID=UPI000F5919D5|nr:MULTISPECIES: DUF6576 domain-containing protein [Amniculibacterium]
MTLVLILIIVIFAFYFFRRKNTSSSSHKNSAYTLDDEYNERKINQQKEIDHLLSKMGKNGIDDLSEKDRKRLDELSKNLK